VQVTSSPPLYVRLFNLLKAIRELPPFNALTGEEELLLEDLIVQWHEHGVLKMSDLMSNAHYGPRSTVYRRLIALRDKGVILVENAPDDKRERYVKPSEAAQSYIAQVRSGVDDLIKRGQAL
jgi:DNA-binding MarR family transcriptional regulator